MDGGEGNLPVFSRGRSRGRGGWRGNRGGRGGRGGGNRAAAAADDEAY